MTIMKIVKTFIPLFVGLWLMASCSVSAPLIATDNAGEKMGTAEYKVVLGIFRPMNADISIVKAAKKGGITRVATVDFVIVGGLFSTTYRTVVTGN